LPQNSYPELHITSAKFDEPRALSLAAQSRVCVSIHGFSDRQAQRVCMGGLNTKLKESVAENLRQQLPEISIETCPQFLGVHPQNIVNRCNEHGVQLELSTALRKTLSADNRKMQSFVAAVRKALDHDTGQSRPTLDSTIQKNRTVPIRYKTQL
jgi:phage replication-related protein YjqB (UPF0714/DUF867 family)